MRIAEWLAQGVWKQKAWGQVVDLEGKTHPLEHTEHAIEIEWPYDGRQPWLWPDMLGSPDQYFTVACDDGSIIYHADSLFNYGSWTQNVTVGASTFEGIEALFGEVARGPG